MDVQRYKKNNYLCIISLKIIFKSFHLGVQSGHSLLSLLQFVQVAGYCEVIGDIHEVYDFLRFLIVYLVYIVCYFLRFQGPFFCCMNAVLHFVS